MLRSSRCRVDELLEADLDLAPVPRHQRQGGSQAASGRGAADRDAAAARSQGVRALREPLQPRIAILYRSGVRMLRRQPVLDRGHHTTHLGGYSLAAQVVHAGIP